MILESFDKLYHELLIKLSRNPDFVCRPRGMTVKEDIALTFVLTNPRNRLLHSDERATNYGFAVGEFLWYWLGKNDLETMVYYNKRMKDFSDDGRTLNSAYGAIMRGTDGNTGLPDQWSIAKRTLQNDPDSRRAILQIHQPWHQHNADRFGSKDVPCTLSLQFFIRQNALHLHTHMRSNDIIWGLTYDLFSFTMFQECMWHELLERFPDLKLGTYHHTAGSLHLYERHFEQAEKIIEEYERSYEEMLFGDYCIPMAPVRSLGDLNHLAEQEELLRTRKIERIDLEKFTGGCRWMATQLNAHREKRDAERARDA